jgi:hypothetical protein
MTTFRDAALTELPTLSDTVRSCMLAAGVPAFDKRRNVAELVREDLEGVGRFLRTADGRAFFFLSSERRLYDLEQLPFCHLLVTRSGLSTTENVFRFVLDKLQASTSRESPLVEVHTLSHYDARTGVLTVSNGGGGVWRRERGGAWEAGANGEGGVLFFTETDAMPWEPDFSRDGLELRRYLQGFTFEDDGLTAEEQRVLLLILLLHQFFPPLRRTRVIPAFLGPQGSGKTSAMRRVGHLFVGPRFDVTGIHRDREDAFVAAVSNRTVVALDNADSRIPWLEDSLATYATGLRYRLRRLYTTNEEVAYEPRAVLMISSRDPQFNRPDVAERLLPFHCDRPARYQPEHLLVSELGTARGAVMGALLTRAAAVADALAGFTPPAIRFRMADFAAFGAGVFAATGQAEPWPVLLAKLERSQVTFASDGDGLIEALRVLLERAGGRIGPMPIGNLFMEVRAVAEPAGLPIPKTATGLGRRLTLSRRVLELELEVRLVEGRGHRRKRYVTLIPRGGDDGEVGDGVGQDGLVSEAAP